MNPIPAGSSDEAFCRLIAPAVRIYARRYETVAGSAVTSDDLSQAAILGLLVSYRKANRPAWSASLVYRASRLRVIDACRSALATQPKLGDRTDWRVEWPYSLEAVVSEDGSTLGELIADPRLIDHESTLDLDAALASLDPRARTILRLRAYGYSGQEVGDLLGITQSRVSQIIHEEGKRDTPFAELCRDAA